MNTANTDAGTQLQQQVSSAMAAVNRIKIPRKMY